MLSPVGETATARRNVDPKEVDETTVLVAVLMVYKLLLTPPPEVTTKARSPWRLKATFGPAPSWPTKPIAPARGMVALMVLVAVSTTLIVLSVLQT